MDAGDVVLQQLLNGKIQYRVPLFQRTYSWEDENWQRLWDDILEIYAMEQPRSHFIGAIVTLPMSDSPEHCAKFMLIDGQQRMTTLFIILANIRARAIETGNAELASQIMEECLINKYAQRPEEKHKMRPTQKDLEPFIAAVDDTQNAESCQINRAVSFIADLINKGDLYGEELDLQRLHSCIVNYLSIVSIRLDQQDSPHRIFESLNNTGMALTAADLIRNHLFMQIPDESVLNESYYKYWLPMQNRMETETGYSYLSGFFWRYLMMNGSLPRYDEIFESIRQVENERLKENGFTVIDILKEYNYYSNLYMKIVLPDQFEDSPDICVQMKRLNEWEVDVSSPFLLYLYNMRENGTMDESVLLSIMKMIESYIIRRYVCRIPTNRLRRVFAKMRDSIDTENFIGSAKQYLLDNQWPSDEKFNKEFQTAWIYLRSRLPRTRLILSSLENSFDHHEPVSMNETITIEHVMPQTLNDSWKAELGEDFSMVHEMYLHTIGNLTYSGYNSEMGNESFDFKKSILGESHFEMNKQIVANEKWTKDEIVERAENLASRAVKIWSREEF